MEELDEWTGVFWVLFTLLLVGAVLWRSHKAFPIDALLNVAWPRVARPGGVIPVASGKVRAVLAMVRGHQPRSGNRSFDAYQSNACRRMDAEQVAFQRFRDDASRARDQAEFDAFIADRNKPQ